MKQENHESNKQREKIEERGWRLKRRDKHHSKDENGVEIEEDMVDELMAFYRPEDDKNGFYDSQSTIKLTRDNIKAIIMVIYSSFLLGPLMR